MQREQAEPPVAVGLRQGEGADRVGEHRVHGDALQEAGLVRVGQVRLRGGEVERQGPARLADGGGCEHVRGDGGFAVRRPDAHAEGGVGGGDGGGHAGARAALYRRRRRGDILTAGALYKRGGVHIYERGEARMRARPATLGDRRLRKSAFDGGVEIYVYERIYTSDSGAEGYMYAKDRKKLVMDKDYRESGVFFETRYFRVLGQQYVHIQVVQDNDNAVGTDAPDADGAIDQVGNGLGASDEHDVIHRHVPADNDEVLFEDSDREKSPEPSDFVIVSRQPSQQPSGGRERARRLLSEEIVEQMRQQEEYLSTQARERQRETEERARQENARQLEEEERKRLATLEEDAKKQEALQKQAEVAAEQRRTAAAQRDEQEKQRDLLAQKQAKTAEDEKTRRDLSQLSDEVKEQQRKLLEREQELQKGEQLLQQEQQQQLLKQQQAEDGLGQRVKAFEETRTQQERQHAEDTDRLAEVKATQEQWRVDQQQQLDLQMANQATANATTLRLQKQLTEEQEQTEQRLGRFEADLQKRENDLAARGGAGSAAADARVTRLTGELNAAVEREKAANVALAAALIDNATLQASLKQAVLAQQAVVDADKRAETATAWAATADRRADSADSALAEATADITRLQAALDAAKNGDGTRDPQGDGGGGGGDDAPPVVPWRKPFFNFRRYQAAAGIEEALQALDSLSSFRDSDTSYILFHTDLGVVLAENERLRSAVVDSQSRPSASWTGAKGYIVANAGSHRLSSLWRNLYYQFGLMTERLTTDTLRPWGDGQWEWLIGLCKTVCTAAQGQLYADAAAFDRKSKADLDVYQRGYNGSHGTLRWFMIETTVRDGARRTSTGNPVYVTEDLHVDIRFLDKILTSCLAGDYDCDELRVDCSLQENILWNVFRLDDGVTIQNAYNVISDIKREIRAAHGARAHALRPTPHVKVSEYCRELLGGVSKWKWAVDDAREGAHYADIYNFAMARETVADPAASMLFIQAVEHHRRYKLHQAGSGEC